MNGNQAHIDEPQFISFQDFPSINHGENAGQAQLNVNASTHQGFNNLSNDSTGIGIIEDLQGMPDKSEATSSPSFWTIEYYQKYFNVNTSDVVGRIENSVALSSKGNYLISRIRPNPDLYGPFWICITLIFSIAISGNIANYLQTADSNKYHWRYDFHIVSQAATCIFLYAWLLPLALWGALKWTYSNRNTEEELVETPSNPGLLELLCLYGYSLAIYIPVAFLWTIQINWLQWCIVTIATFLSGGVLVKCLWPMIKGKFTIIYVAVILGLHILMAIGFMEYFFHMPSSTIEPLNEKLMMTTHVAKEAVKEAAVKAATNATKLSA